MKKSTITQVTVIVLLALAAPVFAQTDVDATSEATTESDTIEIEKAVFPVKSALPPPRRDPEAILAELALRFEVSVDVLTPLLEQGYRPGEIHSALEIAASSGKTLDEVIALAGTEVDRDWRSLATSLGVELPASPQRPSAGHLMGVELADRPSGIHTQIAADSESETDCDGAAAANWSRVRQGRVATEANELPAEGAAVADQNRSALRLGRPAGKPFGAAPVGGGKGKR